MLSINTNLSSLIVQNSLKQSTNKLNQAIERMTTGAKINHAKDNAANYNIATNMITKLGALQVAEDNCAMGLDMLATANGTLDQISEKLQRLRDLAVQASNGTYGSQSKQAINAEANVLVDEIERLYNTSEYNGINLMKGQVTGSEESNFIKDIDRRDTSKMTTLASVDVSTKLNSGTYSISTPEELAKLATMTNNGLIGENCEFVLGADIDLSGYVTGTGWTPIGTNESENYFKASFDGNGYIVSNLTINRTGRGFEDYYQGLFGYTESAKISNVFLENVNIAAFVDVAGIAGLARTTIISNCIVSGDIRVGASIAGGIVGNAIGSTIEDCYSEGAVSGRKKTGGICGTASGSSRIKNCITTAFIESTEINSEKLCGGIVGNTYTGFINISDCIVMSCSNSLSGIFVGGTRSNPSGLISASGITIENSFYNYIYDSLAIPIVHDFINSKIENVYAENNNLLNTNFKSRIYNYSNSMDLQIGTNSTEVSNISVNFGDIFSQDFSLFRIIGLYSSDIFLLKIDKCLNKLSDINTSLGTTSNRLNSALDEISTQYENLVSSRSTLQDADIAEVSSEYIRQQILQQASATLLSTANQSASIALSLI